LESRKTSIPGKIFSESPAGKAFPPPREKDTHVVKWRIVLITMLILCTCAVALAERLTPSEYGRRLGKARAIITEEIRRLKQEDRGPGKALEEEIGRIEQIRVAGSRGEEIHVDNTWMRREVREILKLSDDKRAERLRALAERIHAIEEEVRELPVKSAQPPESLAAAEQRDRETLETVLSERQYISYRRGERRITLSERIDSWIQRLINWFLGGKEEEKEPGKPGPFSLFVQRVLSLLGPALSYTLIGVVLLLSLVLIALLVIRKLQERGRGEAPEGRKRTEEGEQAKESFLPEERWFGLADSLAAEGDYRGATRALYLGLIASLHRNRLISLNRAKTNWEYLREIRDRPVLHAALIPLTAAFDTVWYGRVDCSGEYYSTYRADILGAVRLAGATGT
jgi:hypothetical protein